MAILSLLLLMACLSFFSFSFVEKQLPMRAPYPFSAQHGSPGQDYARQTKAPSKIHFLVYYYFGSASQLPANTESSSYYLSMAYPFSSSAPAA